MQDANENYQTALNFLGLLQHRYGRKAKQVMPGELYIGMKLREAALTVIEQKSQATPPEIIADLSEGGFSFGEYPLRQLHFALLKNRKAARAEDGSWRWIGTPEALLEEAEREER